MSELGGDIYITPDLYTDVEFPTIELDEILGMECESLMIKSDKQTRNKDDEHTILTGGVLMPNDAEAVSEK